MSDAPVKIRWLSEPAALPAGVTWGMPWREGELLRDETLVLHAQGGSLPPALQTWPMAYWPDGSVKWTAHAAAMPAESLPEFR